MHRPKGRCDRANGIALVIEPGRDEHSDLGNMTVDPNSKKGGTLRIKRSPKIKIDDRGRTVWVGEIETGDFELVSTSRIRALLESGDEEKINEISLIARTGPQGVLIQDCNDGHFDVLEQANLDQLLQDPNAPVVRQADEQAATEGTTELEGDMGLMDTLMLRKILVSEGSFDEVELQENEGGDPYDTSKTRD